MRIKRWVAAATLAASALAAPAASAETIYGVTDADGLVVFDSATPDAVSSPTAVTGLAAGEEIEGIDVRPATLQLYALGSSGQLYRVDTVTAQAEAVGAPLALQGEDFDIDFNPTVDRLRIVSDAEQNLRVNPNTAAVTVDGALAPAGNVTGAAYSNNAPASSAFPAAPGTTLFDIDTASDRLLTQNPPNDGTLVDVGPLTTDLVGDVGFDIATTSTATGTAGANTAYVAGRTADGNDRLYTLDIQTGAANARGQILATEKVKDIAVAAPVPALAVLYTPLTGAQQIVTLRADRPGDASAPVTVGGLQPGERLVGIDRRAANGVLYGVGDSSRVYTVDLVTGAATPVGSPFSPALTGTEFGIDFNPTVDRIRFVSDADANGRLNPDTGARADTPPLDGPLAYAAGDVNAGDDPVVTGAAYTNPVPAASATTLFDIDAGQDVLATQVPPNAGTLNTVGALGVDAEPGLGYDIAARFNHGFAALDPAGLPGPGLYAVNASAAAGQPATGATARIGELGGSTVLSSVGGLAVIDDDALPAAPTPTPGATPSPTPTATPPYAVKRKPRITARARPRRDRRKPFVFRVQGRLVLPAGVTRSAGCKGTVRVVARKKGKVIGRRRTGVKSTCRYKARVKLRKAGRRGTARFAVRYLGSDVLLGASAAAKSRYGRR